MSIVKPTRAQQFGPTLVVLLLWVVFVAGCGTGDSIPDQPNILFISMDTTRLDHCSVYGYERETTPELEKLAAKGVRCDRAYSPMASTGPVHATMFTSLYPASHLVVKNGLSLTEEIDTLAELLGKTGYETAAFVSSFVLDSSFGFAQGFTHYDDDFSVDGATFLARKWEGKDLEGGFDRQAEETTDHAITWLKDSRNRKQPFFLFAHFFDPHTPYEPPVEYRDRFVPGVEVAMNEEEAVGRYDEEIAYMDHEIGRLLTEIEALGLMENTIIVVTADHGEGLMNHGFFQHGVFIYDEAVRVPLLFRWDGKIPSGVTLDAPIEQVDFVPTILSLIGQPTTRGDFQGRDLAPGLLGTAELDASRPIFLQRQHFEAESVGGISTVGRKYGIRSGDWKLIVGYEEKTQELFDLDEDPGELVNLAAGDPDRVLDLSKQIEIWRIRHERKDATARKVSPEDQEKLRSLGYIN